jgi:hypothetical protein
MFFVSMANSLQNRFTSPVTRRHGPPFSVQLVADNVKVSSGQPSAD